MKGGIFMTKNEQVEFELLQDFREGRKSRRQVALLLGISERSVSRRAAKVRELGISGIKHGNYQRTPSNKLSDELRGQVTSLMRSTYFDFNVLHALEKLRENYAIDISYMTLHGWCDHCSCDHCLCDHCSELNVLVGPLLGAKYY